MLSQRGSRCSVLGRRYKERGIDLLCPIWHMLDLTPQGRGAWYAKLDYAPTLHAARG